ncbi:MAG: integral membrane protein DUF106-domain-containing protein [Monoraphidium minutum]|nr:MAG: integral membrane protein DUF106-domain-containing protein [Monoraphidium minutum]
MSSGGWQARRSRSRSRERSAGDWRGPGQPDGAAAAAPWRVQSSEHPSAAHVPTGGGASTSGNGGDWPGAAPPWRALSSGGDEAGGAAPPWRAAGGGEEAGGAAPPWRAAVGDGGGSGGGGGSFPRHAGGGEAGAGGGAGAGAGFAKSRSGLGFSREDERARRFQRPPPVAPCSSIFIKGIPDEGEEADLYKAFEGFQGVKAITMVRDRVTGASRGMARLEFESVEAAQVLMESDARSGVFIGGARLRLDYDAAPPSSGEQQGPAWAAAAAAAQDWICEMCNAMNFARRHECYHCHTARPAHPRLVDIASNEPSPVLKVSGLELQTGEAELLQLFYSIAPVVDCRIVRDKYTRAPRGFAFVEFRSASAAGAAMQACQGVAPPGQAGGVRICYGRSREQDAAIAAAAAAAGAGAGGALPGFVAGGSVGGAGGAAAAAAGAGAAAGGGGGDPYAAWAPKEFDADGVVAPGGEQGADEQQQQQQQQEQGAPAAGGGGGGPQEGADWVLEPSSGYYYNAATSYYYDPNSGLYYHGTSQQWMRQDPETGEFTAAGGGGGGGGGGAEQQQGGAHAAAQHGPQPRPFGPEGPPAAAEAAGPVAGPAPRPAAAGPRRTATIGAAPQLNAQGLLTVVAIEEEREKEERHRRKLQQQRADAAAARKGAAHPPPVQAAQPAPQPPPAAPAAVAVAATVGAGQVICVSLLSAALFEAVMWLMFNRTGAYTRQLDQLDKLGKRMEAAEAELQADPNNNGKKKALQRLEKDLRGFSLSLQGTKFKIGLMTAASMISGMWLINRRFKGVVVAKMPFTPPGIFTNLTHMGLPGDDMTDVSAAFFFATTGTWFRANMQKVTGSGPGRTATKYLNAPVAAGRGDKKSQ